MAMKMKVRRVFSGNFLRLAQDVAAIGARRLWWRADGPDESRVIRSKLAKMTKGDKVARWLDYISRQFQAPVPARLRMTDPTTPYKLGQERPSQRSASWPLGDFGDGDGARDDHHTRWKQLAYRSDPAAVSLAELSRSG